MADETTNTNEPGTANEQQQEPEKLQLTQNELDAMLQKEADKRVTEAIKKREAKFQTELQEKIKQERREAEELAKLSQEERAKVEKEKAELEFNREREEFAKERREFEREKLEVQTGKILVENKLPAEFAPWVMGEDAETTMERVKAFETKWQEAIEREVNERLKGKTPRFGGKPVGKLEVLQEQLKTATKLEERMSLQSKIFELQQKE